MDALVGRIFTSNLPPQTTDGSNGDYWRDTSTENFYARNADNWSLIFNFNTNSTPIQIGANFLSGSGVPQNSLASDDTYYRDIDNQDLYYKNNGVWSFVGNLNTPPDGVGSTILSGVGIPLPEVGSNGMYWLDTSNQYFYSKSNDTWLFIGSFSGLTPSAGTIWHTGEINPPSDAGGNGHYWHNTATGNIFFNVNGVWQLCGSWSGQGGGGAVGGILTGNGVPSNEVGTEQAYYRDMSNQDIYYRLQGEWSKIGTWQPYMGPVWLEGVGGPNGDLGKEGDYYRNKNNQDIYTKVSQNGFPAYWQQIGNLAGGGGGNITVTVGNWDLTPTIRDVYLDAPIGCSLSVVDNNPDGLSHTVMTLVPPAIPVWQNNAIVAAFSPAGIQGLEYSGTTVFGAIYPTLQEGDNLIYLGMGLVNANATIGEVVGALQGTSTDVWMLISKFFNSHVVVEQHQVNVAPTVLLDTALPAEAGAIAAIERVDQQIMVATGAGASGPINYNAATIPQGQSLKQFFILVFNSSIATLNEGRLETIPAPTGGALQLIQEANYPEDWVEGKHYRITGAGKKEGRLGQVNDLVIVGPQGYSFTLIKDDANLESPTGILSVAMANHVNATDPHGDRAYTDAKVAQLVNGAPETLNQLNEITAALGNNPDFYQVMLGQLANKVDVSDIVNSLSSEAVDKPVSAYQANVLAQAVQTRLRFDAVQALNSSEKSNVLTSLGLGSVNEYSTFNRFGNVLLDESYFGGKGFLLMQSNSNCSIFFPILNNVPDGRSLLVRWAKGFTGKVSFVSFNDTTTLNSGQVLSLPYAGSSALIIKQPMGVYEIIHLQGENLADTEKNITESYTILPSDWTAAGNNSLVVALGVEINLSIAPSSLVDVPDGYKLNIFNDGAIPPVLQTTGGIAFKGNTAFGATYEGKTLVKQGNTIRVIGPQIA